MYRERALLKFKRYYLHGVRNGFDSEKAATEAVWKARDELLEEMRADNSFESNAEREDVWSEALLEIMLFRRLLENVPIDRKVLEERRQQKDEEEKILEQGAAAEIAKTVVKGLETQVEEKGNKDATGT